ncbi:MAG: cytochrome P450 [Candidatus Eremiobacterota bacterium]
MMLSNVGSWTPAQVPQAAAFFPSGPEDVAEVGSLRFLSGVARHFRNPVGFFQEFHERFGPSFETRLPTGRRFLFETRTEQVQEVLTATDNPRFGCPFAKSSRQGHGLAFLLGSENVFSGSGQAWETALSAIKPHLEGRRMHTPEMFDKIGGVLDAHLDRLAARLGAGEAVVDVQPVMQAAALDVAMQTMFGTRLSDAELQQTQKAFDTVSAWVARETLNPTDVSLSRMFGKLGEAYERLQGLAERVISDRRASGQDGEDVLGGLLSARDEHGQPFSDERLRNEVLTLMLAGHETTSTWLSWAVSLLARHPQAVSKVEEQVAGLEGRLPDPGEVRDLTAVQDALMESLRLHSPAYFVAREATADTTLGGREVKQGTTVVMSVHQMHRSEEQWGVERTGFPADEFHPERFEQPARSKFFPFGGGNRVCAGFALARVEAALMLTKVVQRFEILPTSGPLEVASDLSVHPREATVRLRVR